MPLATRRTGKITFRNSLKPFRLFRNAGTIKNLVGITFLNLYGFLQIFISKPFIPNKINTTERKCVNTRYGIRKTSRKTEIVPKSTYAMQSIICTTNQRSSRTNVISGIVRVLLLKAEVLPVIPHKAIRHKKEEPVKVNIIHDRLYRSGKPRKITNP